MKTLTEIAESYIGYTEGPNNDTAFGQWYGLHNQPWCAMAASQIFHRAGLIKSVAPKTKPKGFASCDEWLKYLTKNDQLVPIGEAQRGDLVFFQFDADAQPDHVGIVKYHNKTLKYIKVWEGNTSADTKGSQSNGDGFYLKKRGYGTVMAVARPKTTKGARDEARAAHPSNQDLPKSGRSGGRGAVLS
jgi:hypothetical protein